MLCVTLQCEVTTSPEIPEMIQHHSAKIFLALILMLSFDPTVRSGLTPAPAALQSKTIHQGYSQREYLEGNSFLPCWDLSEAASLSPASPRGAHGRAGLAAAPPGNFCFPEPSPHGHRKDWAGPGSRRQSLQQPKHQLYCS